MYRKLLKSYSQARIMAPWLFLLLFLVPATLISSELTLENKPLDANFSSLFSKDQGHPKEQDTSSKIAWHKQSDEVLRNHFVEGTPLLHLKWAYESAPEMVKDCIRHLNDPDFYDSPGYRFLVLYGESGCGKSTISKMIPQYANWDLLFYTPQDIQGVERNKGAEKLRNLMDSASKRTTPVVVIFDEFNQFLENAESKHHDNDATSKEFWTLLDKLPEKINVFVICTANRLHKIPQQVKTRIKPYTCKIKEAPTLQEKKKALLRHVKTANTALGDNAELFLMSLLQNHSSKKSVDEFSGDECDCSHWNYRDYMAFFEVCKMVYRESDKKSSPMVFGLEHLKKAKNRIAQFEKDSLCGFVEMTDEERQELHQAQNMQIQLLIQRYQKNGALGLRSPGLCCGDANRIYALTATKEQKRLMEENIAMDEIKKPYY